MMSSLLIIIFSIFFFWLFPYLTKGLCEYPWSVFFGADASRVTQSVCEREDLARKKDFELFQQVFKIAVMSSNISAHSLH